MSAKLFQKIALTIALFSPHFAIASGIDPFLTLSSPTLTNGQVQFSLNGEPGIPCVIESSPDLANWAPVLTNSDSGATRTITLDASDTATFYRATIPSFPVLLYALGVKTTINANGNSFVSDSFNSSDTNLSTEGIYDPSKISTNGDVAAVRGIINISTNIIDGNLFLGPAATFASGTNTVLGTVYTNRTLNFPDVTLPSLGSPPAAPLLSNTNWLTMSGNYSINNSSAIYVAPGINVTILVTTPNFNLNIQIGGGFTNSGTANIYLAGTNATFSSVFSFRARNLLVYGLPSLTKLTMTGQSNFEGVIYAPSTDVVLDGGGYGAVNLEGACIANSITMKNHCDFIFDEDLLNLGQFP